MFVREQAGQRLTDWRNDVKAAAEEARCGADTITGAVSVRIIFYINRPASVSEKKRLYPSVQPDLDKLIRAVLDAIVASGIIKDDALVVEIAAVKRYANDSVECSPGAWIVVSEITTLQETQTL